VLRTAIIAPRAGGGTLAAMRPRAGPAACLCVVLAALLPAPAAAQAPPPVAAPLTLSGPALRATAVAIPLAVRGAAAGERAPGENDRQRMFARAALGAGATAVIGADPHVLQPIRRPGGRRLVAYSLGDFVWAAGSPQTTSTGILRVRLSGRGVEGSKLVRARIEGTRPRLLG